MKNEFNGYSLSKQWFAFAYENPDKVKPVHGALYFWIIELSNSLGWKQKIGVPTKHTMEMIGVKDYRAYKNAFDDLIKWGFIQLLEKSKNQHTANIVALVFNVKAHPKAYIEIPGLLMRKTQKHHRHNKTIETIEEENPELFTAIISYLNEKTGKKFIVTDNVKDIITDRINEGYNEADFKKVIDIMTKQWLKDPKMNNHLVPDTLFGPKFQNYLNRTPSQIKTPGTAGITDIDHGKGLHDE